MGDFVNARSHAIERVIIAEGSFLGIEAIFLASDGEERVMLLLNILQSEQTLSFPIESVRSLASWARLGRPKRTASGRTAPDRWRGTLR